MNEVTMQTQEITSESQVRATGAYHNLTTCREEYWAVNQATGEKRLLAWITDEVDYSIRREYRRRVWSTWVAGLMGETS